MFAFSLVPAVMFALGVVEIIDHLGGLRAAQKLLSPVLRPLMGIPGITGLAMVTSFQSTDAGAGMTRMLKETELHNGTGENNFCRLPVFGRRHHHKLSVHRPRRFSASSPCP